MAQTQAITGKKAAIHDPWCGGCFDLDRKSLLTPALLRFARLRGNMLRLHHLMGRLGPRVGELAIRGLACSKDQLIEPAPVLLRACRFEPAEGLTVLIAEWMEFRKRVPESPWRLLIHTAAREPEASFQIVTSLWEHVGSLKRQLDVPTASAFLWVSQDHEFDPRHFLDRADAILTSGLMDRFEPLLATALMRGKPIVCPASRLPLHSADGEAVHPYITKPTILGRFDGLVHETNPAQVWHVPEPLAIAGAIAELTANFTKGDWIPWPAKRGEAPRPGHRKTVAR